ncbi:NAD binding Rossmann fold oxidoreductase-like protein [Xylona heveae TC161]|uniref:NAD binding Rossmann fold oxidoreductase-like protein n=1 Tax=Xylona heveae (strain CBS 132557 / TC161) TaxID=1328760 RepID=A0A165GRI2_XYLHT|nr:NAD binding Rossmann fold oxidoreductase-like protein [Xylona heveae TC161]KZF22504.1 NAD binding Rossmann fold oxidoreductase-like protein [Xylona heveae TC161]
MGKNQSVLDTATTPSTDSKQTIPECEPPASPSRSENPPRILVIGAGSRGNSYARAIRDSTAGKVVAVAEPIKFKRHAFGGKYIWGESTAAEGQEFGSWEQWLEWEKLRRKRQTAGEKVPDGVDGVLVCTLDETHVEIITAIAPLNLHILSEKPLATKLEDCLRIYSSLLPSGPRSDPSAIFAVGHVLRYSPHNMLLRRLLLEERVVGELISIEHTEPVGWWHFSHSYVRGNWRKESTTAPSLLTKSCHDIDLLLWLLSSPPSGSKRPPHLPVRVSSTGHLVHFKPSRKPASAGDATNCLSCPAESQCQYSAKKIYLDRNLRQGNTGWPVKIVSPDIEDIMQRDGLDAAERKLLRSLAEDHSPSMSAQEIEGRPWFGRCVFDAGNDVCDDQFVTIEWEDDPIPDFTDGIPGKLRDRGAKTATLHMIAFTEKICERRGRVYGDQGEVEYDSNVIRVHSFASNKTKTYHPRQAGGGHGGGDDGLASQFVSAIEAVKNQCLDVKEAQVRYVGCTLEDVIRSHALVFAAEEARRCHKVVNWTDWWQHNVELAFQK